MNGPNLRMAIERARKKADEAVSYMCPPSWPEYRTSDIWWRQYRDELCALMGWNRNPFSNRN
jgi:hypothetical protein